MALWKLFFIATAGFLFLQIVVGVDKNNFKTCEQSSFCRRLRQLTPESSPYELLSNTIVLDKHTLSADIRNNNNNVLFTLKLTALVDGTFRVLMDEKQPLKPRYRVQYALSRDPTEDKLSMLDKNVEAGTIKVGNSQGHSVVIHIKPLKLDFYNPENEMVVSLNEKGLTTLEHLRVKTESNEEDKKEDGENPEENVPELIQEETDPGAWEENYKSHHDTKPRGPEGLSMDVSFPKASHVYGIPEHADSFALKSTKGQDPYRLYNLDVFEYELDSTMAIYASVPVVYAHGANGNTAGVFWLNSAETWVDVEAGPGRGENVVSSLVNLVSGSKTPPPSVRFISESGILETFVFMGPSPTDCFRQYTGLTGTANLPQMFALAYHQSRWNYNDEDDVRSVDEGFDRHDIPLDVIWLDIEYTDRKKYFTWDSIRFAHPQEMVTNLTAKGRKMVIIIDPHIKREGGYFVHEDATNLGYYVKNKDGKDYEGWCWPGSSSYLDFFDPKVREYYSGKYSLDSFTGTTNDVYIWNDMNEPSVFNGPEITMPKDCIHYGDWEHRHVHNLYGLLHVMSTYEGVLKRSEGTRRPFILSRAAFAGTQRYAAIWTGDNSAEWSHLTATVPMCLSLSVAGISFCGADVGGFFKYPEAELMTRWYQAGAFQPFFRAHSHIDTKRREPYLYDATTMSHIRDAIRRRYSYLPLWYTLFYEHSVTGSPVMRPIFMHFPKETDFFAVDNEYLLGNSLLVRPVTEEGASSVTVLLPGSSTGDIWYDVDTYQPLQPGKLSQPVTISKIPVYQRGGTIISKKERMRRASSLMANDPYTLIVALSNNFTAEGTLYIDDGESFDYRTGKYIYAKITFKDNALTYSFIDQNASYPTKAWLERVVIAGMKTPPKKAELKNLSAGTSTALHLTYHTGNDVLVVRKPEVGMGSEWKIVLS